MRTLKRTLSLVLVLAMVLGLGVFNVSAAAGDKIDVYSDKDQIGENFKEAVDIMTAAGIIEGMSPDTPTLEPNGTYTRAQAAKILTYMKIGVEPAEALAAPLSDPFDDVKATSWSSKYIAYCQSEGLISGYGDGNFGPSDPLTGYQWAAMLLRAVGYDANEEYKGPDWAINVAKDAIPLGLFEGDISGASNDNLVRQQAILYAYNTFFNIYIVSYSNAMGTYVRQGDADNPTLTSTTLSWAVFHIIMSVNDIEYSAIEGTRKAYSVGGYEVEDATVEDVGLPYRYYVKYYTNERLGHVYPAYEIIRDNHAGGSLNNLRAGISYGDSWTYTWKQTLNVNDEAIINNANNIVNIVRGITTGAVTGYNEANSTTGARIDVNDDKQMGLAHDGNSAFTGAVSYGENNYFDYNYGLYNPSANYNVSTTYRVAITEGGTAAAPTYTATVYTSGGSVLKYKNNAGNEVALSNITVQKSTVYGGTYNTYVINDVNFNTTGIHGLKISYNEASGNFYVTITVTNQALTPGSFVNGTRVRMIDYDDFKDNSNIARFDGKVDQVIVAEERCVKMIAAPQVGVDGKVTVRFKMAGEDDSKLNSQVDANQRPSVGSIIVDKDYIVYPSDLTVGSVVNIRHLLDGRWYITYAKPVEATVTAVKYANGAPVGYTLDSTEYQLADPTDFDKYDHAGDIGVGSKGIFYLTTSEEYVAAFELTSDMPNYAWVTGINIGDNYGKLAYSVQMLKYDGTVLTGKLNKVIYYDASNNETYTQAGNGVTGELGNPVAATGPLHTGYNSTTGTAVVREHFLTRDPDGTLHTAVDVYNTTTKVTTSYIDYNEYNANATPAGTADTYKNGTSDKITRYPYLTVSADSYDSNGNFVSYGRTYTYMLGTRTEANTQTVKANAEALERLGAKMDTTNLNATVNNFYGTLKAGAIVLFSGNETDGYTLTVLGNDIDSLVSSEDGLYTYSGTARTATDLQYKNAKLYSAFDKGTTQIVGVNKNTTPVTKTRLNYLMHSKTVAFVEDNATGQVKAYFGVENIPDGVLGTSLYYPYTKAIVYSEWNGDKVSTKAPGLYTNTTLDTKPSPTAATNAYNGVGNVNVIYMQTDVKVVHSYKYGVVMGVVKSTSGTSVTLLDPATNTSQTYTMSPAVNVQVNDIIRYEVNSNGTISAVTQTSLDSANAIKDAKYYGESIVSTYRSTDGMALYLADLNGFRFQTPNAYYTFNAYEVNSDTGVITRQTYAIDQDANIIAIGVNQRTTRADETKPGTYVNDPAKVITLTQDLYEKQYSGNKGIVLCVFADAAGNLGVDISQAKTVAQIYCIHYVDLEE